MKEEKGQLTKKANDAISLVQDNYPEMVTNLNLMLEDTNFVNMINSSDSQLLSLVQEIHSMAYEFGYKKQLDLNQRVVDSNLSQESVAESLNKGKQEANTRSLQVLEEVKQS